MQFDDRLATLLSARPATGAAKAALWSQLIDLLAQGAIDHDACIEDRARELSIGVPADRRLATAKAIAPRTRNPTLVRIFGADNARVAAPIMLGAVLTPGEWQQVIPDLAPHARALLRERRDLPREATDALLGFGHSDFAIPSSFEDQHEPTGENTQIRDLMARIVSWREQRDLNSEAEPPQPLIGDKFRFEVDAAGSVNWTDSRSRAALIGLSLAEAHQRRDFGFDAHATGAFLKRSPFRHARLTLPEARTWSVAGDPVFRDSDGRFLGYRCFARPLSAIVYPEFPPAAGGQDTFRQVAHELRTPLNAVHGFAAMIEAQLLGPVGQTYRRRAVEIGKDAARVLSVIDDLDGWSRAVAPAEEPADVAKIMASVSDKCQPIEEEVGANLLIRVTRDLPLISVGTSAATRLVDALARVTLSGARAGERLSCDVRANSGLTISFGRPAAFENVGTDALMSEQFDQRNESEDVLPLGLGFTLRMVKAQARAVGGELLVNSDAFVLRLPIASDSAEEASGRI